MPQDNDENTLFETSIDVEYPPKPSIHCVLTSKQSSPSNASPALIFTHGAGGTLNSDAIANFVHGFARHSSEPILCFQGNMNLMSRTKMFRAVMDDQSFPHCLGGRSMGARAAVMAATAQTTHLVLVSYPLHTDKEVRDQILIELPAHVKVIFVSGDKDSMCDLQRLRDVRRRMKCSSWQVTVQGADHGMAVRPKVGTEPVGQKTGEIVSAWLKSCDEAKRECRLRRDGEASIPSFSGWEP